MTTTTEKFVEKLLAVNYDSLPVAAIEASKQVTLDTLAVMLAGSTEPLGVGRISIEYVRDMGGTPQATVVAGGFKTSMFNAAYVNGTLAHVLDWDANWFPIQHPACPTLPAILAIGENFQLSGKKIIEAIVGAFEVQAGVRCAATGMIVGLGFHPPGMTGIFGAVAGAAKLLDLSQEEALMAFGLVGSRAGSLSINTGTMTKSSHAGHAARMGTEAAMLAKKGWTASADVFGPKGFFDTFMAGKAKPELLYQNFGSPFRMVDPGLAFKKHPCNYFNHRPIDAALALREEYKIKAAHIDRIRVTFPHFDYVNRPEPRTGLDGKFSVQYTTLAALLDGEVTIDSFTNERRFAPDVAELLPKVQLQFDESIPLNFDKIHCTVDVWLKDGRQVSRRMDKLSGFVGFPLTREQRLKKFFSCAKRVLDEKAAIRMLELVEQLETLPNVAEIMDIARCERR